MKKVFLLSAVAGLVFMTSCKKETVESATDALENVAEEAGSTLEEGVDNIADTVGEVVDGMPEAPKMEDAGLQEWANKLKGAAVKVKDAALSGDADALKAATGEIATLGESLKDFQDSPELEKAKEYYEKIRTLLNN